MEIDFDKEMDALLRGTVDRGVLVGDKPKVHLDADAIAAFAENAVPEKSRIIYTQHLAECDPCRKALSNLITLNAAAEPVLAAAAAPVIASVPWYRKLFAAPNLAYVMGGLVLVFGGLLGFIVLQNSLNPDGTTVSQVQEPQSFQSAPALSEGSSVNATNTAANSNSVANVPGEIPRSVGTAEEGLDPNVAATPAPPPPAVTSTSDAAAPTAAPVDSVDKAAGQPVMKEAPKVAKDEIEFAKKAEEKRADNDQEAGRKKDDGYNKNMREQNLQNQSQVQMMPNSATKSAGPSRNEMQRDNRTYNDDSKLRAKQSAPSGAGVVGGVRTAGGRKFEMKQGVWYDTSYRGQGTKNVRRGTTEYRDLDSGLRSIAESIAGTVVVVWNGKAYRIQ